MAKFVRKFTKRIFIISNCILVVLFLLACLNIFLNPQQWWFVAVLGLAFPFLLVLMIAFVVLWAVFRSRWIILPVVALILAFTNIRAAIAFHFASSFDNVKDSGSLRVMTWNVMWFDEQTKADKSQKSKRREMIDIIAQQGADVLCFQEFFQGNKEKKVNLDNISEIVQLGYPYYVFAKDYAIGYGKYYAGVAIFSKYPISDSSRLEYPGKKPERAAESLISADILFQGTPIRIYTTHLQSNLLKKDDYRSIEIIRNAEDSIMEASKSLLRKLKTAYRLRGEQAEMVRKAIDQSPHPELVCGDFNDVPNSYTYFKIKGDRQDAFIARGSGIGRTYSNISPTLRIDYILASKKFTIQQVKRLVLPYSDHYPVVADLRFAE